ncbi:DinB family protein [Kitasatospora sp. NPDC051853]|uniref:DinB family protein n=1 Tax=Kitasatospora sp. NPDC051853 TaxID=3364058 RepID=UPI003796E564
MTRTDMPQTLDERTTLLTFLDYARATALAKVEALDPADAGKAPLPGSPLMTLGGLISHLRWVEHWWFDVVLLGGEDRGPWTQDDPDGEMRIGAEVPIATLVAEYQEEIERHREQVAGLDLDTWAVGTVRSGTRVNLRWILFHLVEEISRHNGHLDLLREIADGTTGD